MKLEFIWAKIALFKVKQCGLCDYHCPLCNNLLSLASSKWDTFLACEVYGWGMLINSNVENAEISCRMASEISLQLLRLHLVNKLIENPNKLIWKAFNPTFDASFQYSVHKRKFIIFQGRKQKIPWPTSV